MSKPEWPVGGVRGEMRECLSNMSHFEHDDWIPALDRAGTLPVVVRSEAEDAAREAVIQAFARLLPLLGEGEAEWDKRATRYAEPYIAARAALDRLTALEGEGPED